MLLTRRENYYGRVIAEMTRMLRIAECKFPGRALGCHPNSVRSVISFHDTRHHLPRRLILDVILATFLRIVCFGLLSPSTTNAIYMMVQKRTPLPINITTRALHLITLIKPSS